LIAVLNFKFFVLAVISLGVALIGFITSLLPPIPTPIKSSAASDVYKRHVLILLFLHRGLKLQKSDLLGQA
ncbi:hypothetical protein, partial [Enterobacter hormaechei]|uniref:hypothetical protein n=1 Tax=Enterobacter hormaechei TaxID=158836 RepID=UPI00403A9746